MPLSILSDFEEFAIYDTRIKPAPGDPSSKARVFYCTYDQYADKWAEIAAIFSRDAILKGSFDKYADSAKKKKGTTAVDTAFLEEIERWRELLARNFALRNPSLTVRDLNFAVQKTIDRLVFLRICEDRGTEDYGRLRIVANGTQTYLRLLELFRAADARYNSGLFHFSKERNQAEEPDTLTPHLALDDKTLKHITAHLYYPESPYEFSVLPADILGSVYERFLGKTIRLTEGHQAKIEEKPEVRKAGGVYYTPSYIVDYIVQNTLGKLLTPNAEKPIALAEAAKLKVVDPACGSGSFLIVAYQYLLDWHRDRYAENPDKWRKGKTATLYLAKGGEWRLTTAEKKRILLNNIHGVDIDAAAVEVTKLSLLLKVLEGETVEIAQRDFIKERERILPDLANNIKCGNSLIGPDFYDQPEMDLLDDDARYRVNVFDWNGKHGFPAIMKSGGFDAVLGNPPYIRIQTMRDTQPEAVDYFGRSYASTAKGNYDIYVMFVERALGLLNKAGKVGYIVPNKFFSAEYGLPLRTLLSNGKHLKHIVHFGDQQVFASATIYTCLLFLTKAASRSCRFIQVDDLHKWIQNGKGQRGEVLAEDINGIAWNVYVGPAAPVMKRLLLQPKRLKDIAHLFVGLQTDSDDVFILNEVSRNKQQIECESAATGETHSFEASHLKPFLKGSLDIRRYGFSAASKWLIFPYQNEHGRSSLIPSIDYTNKFPLTWKYLEANRTRLAKRAKGALGPNWHGYVYKKNHLRFQQPKILAPAIATGACFAWDAVGDYYFVGSGGGGGGGYGILLDPELGWSPLFLLGILNSRLTTFFLKKTSSAFRGGYIALNRQYIEGIPLPSALSKVGNHDRMVSLVEKMLALVPRRRDEGNPQAAAQLDAQISATDRQIDRLVYELYSLTEEEIALVEGA